MKEYTNESPKFSDTILIIEEGKDYNHADTVNVATKQLLDNQLVQKGTIENLVSTTNDLEKAGFTFIIDSEQKILEWLHKKEGNDYSRILVKKKEDGSRYGVEIGRKDHEYTRFPLSADYVEFDEGVQVQFSHPDGANRENKAAAILSCKNSRNVVIESYVPADYIFSGGSHINATVLGVYCGGFNGCDGLYGCTVNGCDISWVSTYPFNDCKHIFYCEVKGSALNEDGFRECTELIGCSVNENNVTIKSFYRPFYKCRNLYNCTAAAISFQEGESNTFCTQLFSNCRGLYSCAPVPIKDRDFNGYVRSACAADHDLWDEAQKCFWQLKVNNGQLLVEKVYEDE